MEVGPMGFSMVVLDDTNCFSAVVVYAFPADTRYDAIDGHIRDIINNEKLLQQSFKKTTITWSFPESILVPHEWMNTALMGDMLNLVFGDLAGGVAKTDFVYKHNLHNVYRVPGDVDAIIATHYLYSTQVHQYSLLPDLVNDNNDRLFLIFYQHRFTAMLSSGGALKVIQNFPYRHPEDAAFHLLNICKNFDLSPATVTLHLQGMIDAGSNLYAALYKYFLNMEFAGMPEAASYSDAIKAYPAHFFSHLFAQALCA